MEVLRLAYGRPKNEQFPGTSGLTFAQLTGYAIFSAMRYYIFGCGLAVLALGWAATAVLEKDYAQGFLNGALQLGGALLICGLFSIKMLSLLGAARGLGNVPGLVKFLAGDRPRGVAPLLEMGVTLVCAVLLVKVIRAWQRERLRRMLEEE
jgi:hypothetical protein